MAVLRPIMDRVLILPHQVRETTGGILLPGKGERASRGLVVAVGPGALHPYDGVLIPPSVSVGDVVYYEKWSGQDIEVGGADFVMLRANQILLRLEKEA